MNSRDSQLDKPSTDKLGDLLRHWRSLRGKSQLDLSVTTGISQRQISFIESGRSIPTRRTLIDISQTLAIPLRDRNTLLLAAGYAPLYSESEWDSAEMQSIHRALTQMLHRHEPFPAFVMDRYWNVLLRNDSAPRFFNLFFDMTARPGPRNILHLMFDPAGMRPFIANWENAARGLIERVYRESIGHAIDDKTQELIASLLAYPDVKSEWQKPETAADLPMIPMSFVKDGRVLNYFSLVTTVGTPLTTAAQELRLECLFPADEATEAAHIALMQDAPMPDLPRP